MDGIINIYKPLGLTSHDVVNRVRRALSIKRVGHTGTLDPQASGVLPICVGKATKAADFLASAGKRYKAVLRLGASTDTQDATGRVLEEKEVKVTPQEIEAVINTFVGELEQEPPMYSAVKIGGKKLYELARAGKEIERVKRKITIFSIDILSIKGTDIEIDVSCSKGTYIRTLCHDIGQVLGCGGHMAALERTVSGRFDVSGCVTLEKFEEAVRGGDAEKYILPLDELFPDCPCFVVTGAVEKRIRSGCAARAFGVSVGQEYRVYSAEGDFLCLSRGEMDEEFTILRQIKSFC